MTYLREYGSKITPQSEPIPGSNQVPNSAGGFSFEVDDAQRVRRFLILGSEGGSYYAGERELTTQNIDSLRKAIAADGVAFVEEVKSISLGGRAPKNDPALFALALAASIGDKDTRSAAFKALPEVARTATHLFTFLGYADGFRGWGRGLRDAVARWYTSKTPDKLGYQVVKYRQRAGYTHRDALRLSHPKPTPQTSAILTYAAGKKPESFRALPEVVQVFEQVQASSSPVETMGLIQRNPGMITREMIPTDHLTDAGVWSALIADSMPITALIRNLGNMTKVGALKPMSAEANEVVSRLSDGEALRRSRVHPIQVLSALLTYKQGHGTRGSGEWSPVPAVVDALDKAFYASFGNVEPTGKRTMLALDVSASMEWGDIAGVPGLTPRNGSAAMALITANVEPNHMFTAFTNSGAYGGTRRYNDGLTELPISPRQRLDDVVQMVSDLPFGGTDCALPMIYALEKGIEIDTFVVYTDSETWAGDIHPTQALNEYRRKTGIPAKLVVVGMLANPFTIADPNDPGMLDVVGFDTATPQAIAEFSRG